MNDNYSVIVISMIEPFDHFQPKSLDKTLKYETKILGVSPESLKEKFHKSGFKKRFEHDIKTQWLKSDDYCEEIRVRTENKVTTITRKAWNRDGSSDGQPLTTEHLGDADFKKTVSALIDKGWVKAGSTSYKKRVRYIMDLSVLTPGFEVHLDFDTYSRLKGESIPEFMKIKTSNLAGALLLARLFGFTENDCVNYGPKNLLNHYYPERSITDNRYDHSTLSTDYAPIMQEVSGQLTHYDVMEETVDLML